MLRNNLRGNFGYLHPGLGQITAENCEGMWFYNPSHPDFRLFMGKLEEIRRLAVDSKYPEVQSGWITWGLSMAGYDNPKWVIVQADDHTILHHGSWCKAPTINVLTEPIDNLDDALTMWASKGKNESTRSKRTDKCCSQRKQ